LKSGASPTRREHHQSNEFVTFARIVQAGSFAVGAEKVLGHGLFSCAFRHVRDGAVFPLAPDIKVSYNVRIFVDPPAAAPGPHDRFPG
jgi:hypothetical protein